MNPDINIEAYSIRVGAETEGKLPVWEGRGSACAIRASEFFFSSLPLSPPPFSFPHANLGLSTRSLAIPYLAGAYATTLRAHVYGRGNGRGSEKGLIYSLSVL